LFDRAGAEKFAKWLYVHQRDFRVRVHALSLLPEFDRTLAKLDPPMPEPKLVVPDEGRGTHQRVRLSVPVADQYLVAGEPIESPRSGRRDRGLDASGSVGREEDHVLPRTI